MIDIHAPFELNPAVVHKEIEGQVVLLLPDSYALYTLNLAGRQVWRDLARGRSLAEAAAELAARYGIPLEQAEADVAALAADLLAQGVIHNRKRDGLAP